MPEKKEKQNKCKSLLKINPLQKKHLLCCWSYLVFCFAFLFSLSKEKDRIVYSKKMWNVWHNKPHDAIFIIVINISISISGLLSLWLRPVLYIWLTPFCRFVVVMQKIHIARIKEANRIKLKIRTIKMLERFFGCFFRH